MHACILYVHGWVTIKADLDGTTFAYDYRMMSHAVSRVRAARVMQKVAHNSRHSTLPILTIVVGF